jgi:hypothetical protein
MLPVTCGCCVLLLHVYKKRKLQVRRNEKGERSAYVILKLHYLSETDTIKHVSGLFWILHLSCTTPKIGDICRV